MIDWERRTVRICVVAFAFWAIAWTVYANITFDVFCPNMGDGVFPNCLVNERWTPESWRDYLVGLIGVPALTFMTFGAYEWIKEGK